MNANTYSGTMKQSAQDMATTGSTNNQGSLNDIQSKAKSLKTKSSLFSLCEAPTIHNLTGANIRLEINNVVIKTHEHLISKLVHLNKLVQKERLVHPQSDTLTITINGGNELVSDFLHTFQILGASSIESPTGFDLETLVSGARIGASYEHPALRAFCIKRLDGLLLDSTERLRVARALDLKFWEERVYQELSEREKMITKEEALALDIDAYWQVASMRERQQRNKPRDCTCELLFVCVVLIYTWAKAILGK
ncbi:hypothetical protein RSOL_426600 [Rhizoctonia solani AG-3 Rhs1AP]|uniref:BTB domain-containing protein n=2 Tax=Rhizoctonia solani AG-3 TaxID=1086053 RepID=A0A074S435_9AGAM|nr:hypothetical protein RSOL_426600 [Rhizoctonia solani AG-3 Rhs1AP]KEP44882.1 hypothetical protein V565_356930 [Rhizoctonia solani 123E]